MPLQPNMHVISFQVFLDDKRVWLWASGLGPDISRSGHGLHSLESHGDVFRGISAVPKSGLHIPPLPYADGPLVCKGLGLPVASPLPAGSGKKFTFKFSTISFGALPCTAYTIRYCGESHRKREVQLCACPQGASPLPRNIRTANTS